MQGLSLVELMVAITISLILLGGAVSLFVNNRINYQHNDNLSRLQENARFAMEFLVRDLRMAGYFGCPDDIGKVDNNLAIGTAGDLEDVSFPIEGFEPHGHVGDQSVPPLEFTRENHEHGFRAGFHLERTLDGTRSLLRLSLSLLL